MADWAAFQNIIRVAFKDVTLLQQSLVHRSYLNEDPDFSLSSNERLEFLGDALLDLVIAEKFYQHPAMLSEGEMTKLRAALVGRENLAHLASSLGLGNYLYLGQGEEKSAGRQKPRNLACALEALVGAIFLDQGYLTARDFILGIFAPSIQKAMNNELFIDYKSQLQEIAQATRKETPLYRVVAAEGPEHEKRFTVEVVIGHEVLGRGKGRSKQAAEKQAARHCLEALSAL